LRVASGEPLPRKQEELSINGHAIEARLYAEDPAKGFLPSTGRLESLDLYEDSARVDTGVAQSSEVTPFYDPMIAKVIVHSEERSAALATLALHMKVTKVWPVKANNAFLAKLLADPDVEAGRLDTGLIERKLKELTTKAQPSDRSLSDALNWLVRESTDFDRTAEGLLGFRLNADRRLKQRLSVDSHPVEFHYSPTPDGQRFEHGFLDIEKPGAQLLDIDGDYFLISWPRAEGTPGTSAHDGDIVAPMPGKVIAVDVAEGQQVEAGQRLIVLEAMKMEHALTAPFAGTIAELAAREGSQVQVEALLARVVKAEG
jgi:3-methylcrotonyl-CoA carboxylase alpha subunit